VLFRSFLERNVLFRSFFEFLATYETTFDPQKGQKNIKIKRNVLFTDKK